MAKSEPKAGADWWIWVQFVVLCVSIAANVALWVRTQRLDSAIRIAEYNDRSWRALREFEHGVQDVSSRFYSGFDDPPLSAEDQELEKWARRIEAQLALWTDDVGRHVIELKNKLMTYEAAMGKHPESAMVARTEVESLTAPIARAVALLDGRIELFEQVERGLDKKFPVLASLHVMSNRLERLRARLLLAAKSTEIKVRAWDTH